MADGVWYINDSAAVINPADYVVNGAATIRIRRAVKNYAYYGNSTLVTLWARAGAGVSDYTLSVAVRERSSDPLPNDVPRPPVAPNPITPAPGSVPIPSGVPPYPFALVGWDSKNGAWVWVEADIKPGNGGEPGTPGSFPSLSSFPSVGLYPGT